ncbi:TetR/AcrR family transcriptional regulator [Frateuria aurantia]
MRKSRLETARTRGAILDAASAQLRESGLENISIADIMAAAGLTHGGFYRHFNSKEALLKEALARASRQSLERVQIQLAQGGFSEVVEQYLSIEHRDTEPPRCPYAALGSDIARAPMAIRMTVSEGLASLLELLGQNSRHSHTESVTALATMVGAVILSRITAGTPLSDEFLACPRHLLQQQAH